MNDISSLIITTLLSIFVPIITSTLTVIVKRFVDEKIKDMQDKKIKIMIEEGTKIILDSVNYVQQTYVEELKEKNIFNKEAHLEAFKIAKERAITLLPQEIYSTIDRRYGNVDIFVQTVIESYIAKNKMTEKEKEL